MTKKVKQLRCAECKKPIIIVNPILQDWLGLPPVAVAIRSCKDHD